MSKALFIDRDGIINKDVGYLHERQDVVFIDGIFEVLDYAAKHDYLIIIITN